MSATEFERYYGGMVWTNHAMERLKQRGIYQADALAVLRNPEQTFPAKKDNSVKFIRTVNGRRIHVIGVLNEEKRWVVTSVWVRGEEDRVGWPERIVGALVDKLVGWLKKKFGSK